MKKTFCASVLAMALLPWSPSSWALSPIGGSRFDTVLIPENQPSDCGRRGLVTRATQTVALETTKGLRDVAISPLQAGETVRFTFHNGSSQRQLVMIGSKAEHKKFNISLNDYSNRRYLAPNFLYIDAGQTGELVWTLAKAQECLLDVQVRPPMAPWQSLGVTAIPMGTSNPDTSAPDDDLRHQR